MRNSFCFLCTTIIFFIFTTFVIYITLLLFLHFIQARLAHHLLLLLLVSLLLPDVLLDAVKEVVDGAGAQEQNNDDDANAALAAQEIVPDGRVRQLGLQGFEAFEPVGRVFSGALFGRYRHVKDYHYYHYYFEHLLIKLDGVLVLKNGLGHLDHLLLGRAAATAISAILISVLSIYHFGCLSVGITDSITVIVHFWLSLLLKKQICGQFLGLFGRHLLFCCLRHTDNNNLYFNLID